MSVHFPYLLVLISGPPRSGKNRAGACLAERLDADHFALSNMLKHLTHQHFGMGAELPPLEFESCKDKPMIEFGGMTPRQSYIMFSEKHLKPRYGNDYLGRVGGNRIKSNKDKGRISIVSGVGFIDEIRPMIEAVGKFETLHIKINPLRCEHIEDSREKVNLSNFDLKEINVENRGCSEFLAHLCQKLPELRL